VATAIRIETLPARLGDCLLVECRRPGERPWRMLVDGGPPDTWPLLEARLKRLPTASRQIDVAVVTHVDSDHIGGFIPFVQSDFAREHVRDFWFNGRQHLPTPRERTRSITQGESLGSELTGTAGGRALPWNKAFGGGPVESGEEAGFIEVEIPDGPRITVLSPTRKRLSILAAKWFDALAEARRTTRPLPEPDVLQPLDDLASLAAERSPKDGSAPNGSSIALLVEHRGASVILSGDAFGNVLGAGLKGLATARGLDTLPVDAFKLPHHGSRGNVIEAMLALAPAEHYVFSSNGDTFHHPDDAAVARTVMAAPRGATLWFNYRNARTERWDDPDLREAHGYRVKFPKDPAAGAVLDLPAKP
jgi:beta-lactamase superfamily II metal-dependent hydrolase